MFTAHIFFFRGFVANDISLSFLAISRTPKGIRSSIKKNVEEKKAHKARVEKLLVGLRPNTSSITFCFVFLLQLEKNDTNKISNSTPSQKNKNKWGLLARNSHLFPLDMECHFPYH